MDKLTKVLLGVILALTIGVGLLTYFLYKCGDKPPFIPPMAQVQKFIGYTAVLKHDITCTRKPLNRKGKIKNSACKHVMESARGVDPVNYDRNTPAKNGTLLWAKYGFKWYEKVLFMVDLSEDKYKTPAVKGNKIIYTLPEVIYERVLVHDAQIPYIIDRAPIGDDEDYLKDISINRFEFTAGEVKSYKEQEISEIKKEIGKQFLDLMTRAVVAAGAGPQTKVEVVWE